MKRIIKVCGMTQADNIREVEETGIDMMGFIFYPHSPRCLHTPPSCLPVQAKRVGVFVNDLPEQILSRAEQYRLDYIQLHGNESPDFCRQLLTSGVRLIKAFSAFKATEKGATLPYEGICDYFLFDTPTPQYGGSGEQFDWSVLHDYTGNTPFLLSGGIGLHSIRAIRQFHHPLLAGFDLNSRFETSPGIKDVGLIRQFLSLLP